MPEVATNIERFDLYMQQTDEPIDDIGMHCFSPYECGFFGYCTRNLPKPNVFDVAGARISTKFKCYDQGVISFEDLNTCNALSAGQYKQVEHELFNYAPYIEKETIKDFLGNLSYPLYFLDFESFQPAIPLYDDSHPFEQVVFQYSLHYIEYEGGELKHRITNVPHDLIFQWDDLFGIVVINGNAADKDNVLSFLKKYDIE